MLKGVFGLSLGTIGTRALAALGTLFLAIWLSPTEFGYWASAVSVLAFVSGVANFGEVNGYLSGRGANFLAARGVTRSLNSLLTAVGLLIAVIYALTGNGEIALLAVLIALGIPLVGEGDLLYAASVKHGFFKRAVSVQFAAAILKVAAGVGIAVLSESAIAIAVSGFIFSVALAIGFHRVAFRTAAREAPTVTDISTPMRFSWAANSWTTTLPLQIGFVVAQFVASPYLVGLYYFSYQVTLAITGTVSGPLSKVTLATLGMQAGRTRSVLAIDLSAFFGSVVLVGVAVGSLTAPLVQPLISAQWLPALPALLILLASLPVRLMSPVIDAYQQAGGKWWQGTVFNLIDTIGTAGAALFLLSGDVTVLAVALTSWKVLLGTVRTWIVLRDSTVAARLALLAPLLGGTAFILSGALTAPPLASILFASGGLIGAVWLITALWLRQKSANPSAG